MKCPLRFYPQKRFCQGCFNRTEVRRQLFDKYVCKSKIWDVPFHSYSPLILSTSEMPSLLFPRRASFIPDASKMPSSLLSTEEICFYRTSKLDAVCLRDKFANLKSEMSSDNHLTANLKYFRQPDSLIMFFVKCNHLTEVRCRLFERYVCLQI